MTIELAPHFDPPFVPVLKLRELPSPLWRLLARLRFWSCVVNDWVGAEEGFISDGCSIPLVAFVILSPFGLTRGLADMAGYIHDALYTSQKYDRETCDRILREMIIAMGYPEALAEEFYLGVRIGGGSHWNLPNVPQEPHVAAAMNLSPADTLVMA
jgi:hypothetical protein